MKIDVYSIGFSDGKVSGYAATLIGGDPVQTFISTKVFSKCFNKQQADVLSIIMALRCIKPEYMNAEVILHSPTGYAGQVVGRNDGKWLTVAKANKAIVDEVRDLILRFPNITIVEVVHGDKHRSDCIELVRITCKN